ncbi:MAG TPA: hypothetical protein DCP69_04265 [Candidatus Omnitrophica bacterium]|nr:hypothetical protein [Candidatus Omnitrophota bacterium]
MTKAAHILLLADLHCGSVFGTWVPGFQHSDGEHKLTGFQQWLYQNFNSMVGALPKLDGVVCNGDTIDGKNPYSGGRYCITPEPADQAAAAIELLKPLRKKTKWMRLVDGTDCHDDTAGGALDVIGAELKCDKWAPGNHYSAQVLSFDWRGKVFNIQHHTGNGLLYISGEISKKHMMASIAESDNNLPRADLIATAHIHSASGGWSGGGRYVVVQPCWAGPTNHAIKVMGVQRAYALLTVGAVLVTVDDLGMAVKLIRYPLPPLSVEKIE